jgi:hypothetical protein
LRIVSPLIHAPAAFARWSLLVTNGSPEVSPGAPGGARQP